jgi:cytochrome c oxidase subunit II
LRRTVWSAPAVLGLFNACGVKYAALDTASPEATRITNLHWFVLLVSAAVSFLVIAALAIALTRRRKDETREGERHRTRAVAAAAVLSTLVLLGLLTDSVIVGRAIATPVGPDALRIQIVGHQWWWEVSYPSEPPSDTVITANEIHVPVGRHVLLELSSTDVIHSFWVPNLNGKKDLIPGRPTRQILRPERTGVFEGRCAEFCGYQHAHMGFLLIVEEPDRFEAWLASQRRPAAEPSDAAGNHGRDVFRSSPCVVCHTIRGIGAFGRKAPDLTHLASRRMIASAMLPNTAGHLAGWIVNSQHIKPGNHMPPNLLPAEDLLDLVSYLRSLQ